MTLHSVWESYRFSLHCVANFSLVVFLIFLPGFSSVVFIIFLLGFLLWFSSLCRQAAIHPSCKWSYSPTMSKFSRWQLMVGSLWKASKCLWHRHLQSPILKYCLYFQGGDLRVWSLWRDAHIHGLRASTSHHMQWNQVNKYFMHLYNTLDQQRGSKYMAQIIVETWNQLIVCGWVKI